MVVENRYGSTYATSRDQRNQAIKEDIKHLLEEIWDCDLDEPFREAFSREANKSIHRILHKSRVELVELIYQEDNDALYKLKSHEVGEILMPRHCTVHLENFLLIQRPFDVILSLKTIVITLSCIKVQKGC